MVFLERLMQLSEFAIRMRVARGSGTFPEGSKITVDTTFSGVKAIAVSHKSADVSLIRLKGTNQYHWDGITGGGNMDAGRIMTPLGNNIAKKNDSSVSWIASKIPLKDMPDSPESWKLHEHYKRGARRAARGQGKQVEIVEKKQIGRSTGLPFYDGKASFRHE